MNGIGHDTALLHLAPGIEEEDLVSLNGCKASHQLRPSEKGSKPLLEANEAGL